MFNFLIKENEMKNPVLFVLISLVLSSCAVYQNNDNVGGNITVGTVQKEIKIGMNSVEVIKALGSPNIVQTDDERNEVWIYDKISTQVNASSSQAGAWFLLFSASSNESSRSSSQRTLTIIIKFDKKNKVKDFSYHTSRF